MTQNVTWLNRIIRDNKGIWGIECPQGAVFNSSLIAKTSNCEVGVIAIIRTGDELSFRDDAAGRSETDFSQVFLNFSTLAEENAHQSLCIIVENFHIASGVEQCTLVKTARALQESHTELSCQFVFVGRWSYFSFRAKYRALYGHTSSPAAESKNILCVPPWCGEDVRDLLYERRFIAADPSEFDLVACEFIVEQTAGDEFLIRCAVDGLIAQSGDWTANIEQVLSELVSSHLVNDEIARRVGFLNENSKAELMKLLRVHRLIRNYDSVEVDELWLAGLVQRRKLDGTKNFIQIAGPLINTVVRHVLLAEESTSLANPHDLCFERETISTAAYRSVAQIENLLRNLVVTSWHAELGDRWSDNLNFTKTSSRGSDDEEHIVRFTMSHVRSELIAMGFCSENDQSEPAAAEVGTNRVRQVSILDSALDWQKRQEEHHGVELAHTNVMHFLTTESLEAVLCNKKNGLHGENKPFKKEALMTALEEYRAIRSAVAHNQPIKLNTISRLEVLQRKFLDWGTVFADQEVTR